MSIRLKLILLVSFLLISALGNGILIYKAEKVEEGTLKWVTHTHRVLIEVNKYLSHLKDSESGQRGYLLTANSSYLEPYDSGLSESEEHYNHLVELTEDNPLQQRRLAKVKKLMKLKFDELDQTIKLMQHQKTDEAIAIVKSNDGMQYMEEIKTIFKEFIHTENLLLEQRNISMEQASNNLNDILISGTIFFIFLSLFSIVFFKKTILTPLKFLLSDIKKMQSGDKVETLKYKSNDEIGYLLSRFHEMYKTVQTKTEEKIKTNLQFKNAQKLARIGNWEWEIDNDKIIWSDEVYKIFGLSSQSFAATYDAFINTIHIDDRKSVEEAINRSLKSGEEYKVTHRIVLPDGSEKVVYEKGQVELDKNREPVKTMGTVQDITERFKQNQELKRQSDILNSITDSIFVHNLDGTMLYVNESAYKMRDYTKDELMHMKIQDLDYHDEKIGKEVYEENLKNIQKQLNDDSQATFEVSHKTKHGAVLPLEVTSTIACQDDTCYMISIARDISERKKLLKNLENSEKQYRLLVENSQVGIFKTNLNGEISYMNNTLIDLIGFGSKDEIHKHNMIDIYKSIAQREKLMRQLLVDGKVSKIELEVLTKNNEEKTILLSAHIENETISGIVIDITESKKAIAEMEKLSTVLKYIDDIVIVADKAGVTSFVNDAYVSHTGFEREEAIGKTSSILKSGEHDKDFYKKMWKEILSGNVFRGLITNRKKDGELYYEEKTISPIHDAEGKITSYVSTGKDITQRVELQQKLEKLASTDKLTGIYNRHKFDELFKIELDRVTRYKHPLTLIMFDIDHFKKVNDTYGHDVGDEVLKKLVNTVAENIRSTDSFVRWGGEEFIILCPETKIQETTSLAEKLRVSIESTPFDQVGNITCSFGVTHYKDKENDDDFLKRVDNALYEAKESGRNKVVAI